MEKTYNDLQAEEARLRREKILWMHRRKGKTWAQIAVELGITRERVRQIVKEGGRKLEPRQDG
jgi:DNA-directed RNA polymerase sigma subunit (sigma70/sigma32)